MSSWPKLCVRCGERDSEVLNEQKFKWQQITAQTSAGGTTSTTSVYVHVTTNICNRCRIIALIRWWVSAIISFGMLAVGFPWTFGAFGDSIDPIGLTILLPGIFYFIWLILMRRHYSRFYAHFIHSSGYITGRFRSKEYKAEFDSVFPGGIYVKK